MGQPVRCSHQRRTVTDLGPGETNAVRRPAVVDLLSQLSRVERRRHVQPYPIDPHRPGDILELLFARILERDVELAFRVFVDSVGDANPAGFRQRLQACCHVHAVAPHVSTVGNDLADVDTHAKRDLLLRRSRGIALADRTLDLNGTAQRRYCADELHQQTLAGDPDDPATVLRYFRPDEFAPVCFPPERRAFLARTDEPAVASYIGCEDGHEPSLHSLANQRPLHAPRVAAKGVYTSEIEVAKDRWSHILGELCRHPDRFLDVTAERARSWLLLSRQRSSHP